MKLEKNMGTTDRIVRFVIAAIFAALYFTGMVSSTFGIVLMALAVVFALTATITFCPLYLPFGLSTRGK